MRPFTLLLFFLFSVLATLAQTNITTQDVNFREGAGTKYQSLGVIPNGTEIEVIESSGKWTKIKYQGAEGYISTKFITEGSGTLTKAESESSSGGGTFKTIMFILGAALVLFIIRFVVTRTSEIFNVNPGDGNKLKYRCLNCGKRSTRRGHVYKCNNGGQHEWFEI
jgi:uncharacterized protein YgiM (DUF1202 family)